MGTQSTILEQAISLVDQERSYLREERCAYDSFRERVRLATPNPTDATGPSKTTEQLLVAYREKVMEALDHKAVYGDTLAESLEAELSPTIADLFVSKGPLTHRRKRNILVETTAAIEQREQFAAELDDERAALETFAGVLADAKESLEKLPACSAEEQHIEELLVVWEGYETLREHCERLLERRQQQIREAERTLRTFEKKHARNEFLYSELTTQYPVLSAIAMTIDRIESKRNDNLSVELLDLSQ